MKPKCEAMVRAGRFNEPCGAPTVREVRVGGVRIEARCKRHAQEAENATLPYAPSANEIRDMSD